MSCEAARPLLLDYQRGRLAGSLHEDVHAHLDGCAACAREELAERALTDALERRLPQHAAPAGLKRRLAVTHAGAATLAAAPRPLRLAWLPALAAAILLAVVALPRVWEMPRPGGDASGAAMTVEAVNDHLRLLERGPAVESGGIHQVKPWFAGKLDFAPVVPFEGDADFPLIGGAVERFLDRKAAALVYGRRLHRISLFVVRADGLAWPAAPRADSARGFNLLAWRRGDLGYVLVSDVDARDLALLAGRLGAAPATGQN
jgi:anti-sigma factor RsiW